MKAPPSPAGFFIFGFTTVARLVLPARTLTEKPSVRESPRNGDKIPAPALRKDAERRRKSVPASKDGRH